MCVSLDRINDTPLCRAERLFLSQCTSCAASAWLFQLLTVGSATTVECATSPGPKMGSRRNSAGYEESTFAATFRTAVGVIIEERGGGRRGVDPAAKNEDPAYIIRKYNSTNCKFASRSAKFPTMFALSTLPAVACSQQPGGCF